MLRDRFVLELLSTKFQSVTHHLSSQFFVSYFHAFPRFQGCTEYMVHLLPRSYNGTLEFIFHLCVGDHL